MPRNQARVSEIAERSRERRSAAGQQHSVTRVQFSSDDLARTRFGKDPPPLTEAFLGLAELRRRPAASGRSPWLVHARRHFPATARPLLDLIAPSPPWPQFADAAAGDLDEALELIRATPRSVLQQELETTWRGGGRPPAWLRALADGEPEAIEIVVLALRDFFLTCVAPYWPQITATFQADMAQRVPILTTRGLVGVLDTLHDDLTWRDNSLERAWCAGEFSLDGLGLVLVPSSLWTGPPLFAFQPGMPGGNALVYSARSGGVDTKTSHFPDLAGLLGSTRAGVLRALRTPRSTSELAASVGTSAASASEHAAALRASGLVQTARRGRSVSHSLTPLGRSLLNGNLNAH
jgi:DNA-binding transcriptional ArsR family regulator